MTWTKNFEISCKSDTSECYDHVNSLVIQKCDALMIVLSFLQIASENLIDCLNGFYLVANIGFCKCT